MKRRLIIKNLKDCFDWGMTFKDLSICEDRFKNFEVGSKSGVFAFHVYNGDLSINKDLFDLRFNFEGSRTTKQGIEHVYFTVELVDLPF